MPYSRHVGYLCPGITLSRRVITGRHAALRFTPLPCPNISSLSLSLSPLLLLTSSNILSISTSKSYKLSKLSRVSNSCCCCCCCCFARSIRRKSLKIVVRGLRWRKRRVGHKFLLHPHRSEHGIPGNRFGRWNT